MTMVAAGAISAGIGALGSIAGSIFGASRAKKAERAAKAQAAKNKLQALNVSLKGSTSLIPIVSPISGYVGKISITKGLRNIGYHTNCR